MTDDSINSTPPTPDRAAELERLERVATLMDTAFRLPLVGVRIGWDSLLGLIPGVGDAAALTPAAWIVWRARGLGAPPSLLVRMGANIAADTIIGAVPIVGDLLDIGIKANRRNVALLRDHLESEATSQRQV